MSDPVTNVEIEDVLASIRRLVADGEVPRIQLGPQAADQRRDTLILTPALRVEEAGADAVMHEAEPPPAPLRPESLRSDPFPRDAMRPDLPRAAPQASPRSEAEEGAQGLAARMAARLEAAVVIQDHDWEPDGSEDVPVMDWSAPPPDDAPVFRSRQTPPLRLVDSAAPAPLAANAAAPATLAANAPASASLAANTPAPATPQLARPESTIADTTELAFHHRAFPSAEDEAAARAALDADLARFESGEALLLADADPEPSLGPADEELLRRLVSEILRSELEGKLGERITRNVRKLVRREIYRALQTGELE